MMKGPPPRERGTHGRDSRGRVMDGKKDSGPKGYLCGKCISLRMRDVVNEQDKMEKRLD